MSEKLCSKCLAEWNHEHEAAWIKSANAAEAFMDGIEEAFAQRGRISAVRAELLKQARACRILRSMNAKARAEAYQHAADMLKEALTPSVKCPSNAAGSADDLTPATLGAVAESQGKTPSDAG